MQYQIYKLLQHNSSSFVRGILQTEKGIHRKSSVLVKLLHVFNPFMCNSSSGTFAKYLFVTHLSILMSVRHIKTAAVL